MFFGGDDDEHDFLPSSGGSKLASLFGMDRASQQGGNEALTYTAPKEPKKKDAPPPANQPPSSAPPAVLTAVAVFAYKYVDDKYATQGKLGAAVIGNHAAADYKILLYYTKEKPVSFTKITPSFSFVIQPNNYATFYDDARQNWSVMFESESNLVQFAKQVAIAKANCAAGTAAKLDSLIVQDLVLGDGGTLETGDSVEMKYTGWLLADHAIGNMIDTNASADKPSRFKLGKSKTIRAFDDGIVGMRKNGRRLLVVPPSMAFGSEGKPGKVPPDAVTVFEVEVLRVKLAREPAAGDTASVPASTDSRESPEDDVKPRPKSLTEHPPPPAKSDKAKLISRMARMGQSMLPPMNQTAADTDETNPPVVSSPSPVLNRPDIPAKPVYHQPASSPVHTTQIFTDPSVVIPGASSQSFQHPLHPAFQGHVGSSQLAVFQPQPFNMAGFPYPYNTMPYPNPMYPPPTAAQPPPPQPTPAVTTDPNLPMMLMETRNQNTEVRVSLSKISDKVDRLMDKVDDMNVSQRNALSLSTSMPSMEVGMLVHTVEKIVSENERLKKELLENSSRIEAQNNKISELLQRNQMYVEQSNALLEQRNDSFKSTAVHSQSRVMALEQEKVDMATRLSQASTQLADSQLEVASLKTRESELRQQLERLVASDSQQREELTSLRVQLTEATRQSEQTGAQLRDEQQQRKQLHAQVNELQETVAELTTSRDAAEKSLAERKRKAQEDVSRLEAEIEELKASHERELSSLRERLKLEKNSTELTTAQQLSQVEEELNREWKEKCDRLATSLNDKHQRQVDELTAERHALDDKLKDLEAKVQDMKATRSASESQVESLREELEQLRTWKDKYDSLRSQAVTMKQRYEQRINELDEERTTAEQERQRIELELNRALDAGRRLQSQLAAASASGASSGISPSDVQAEVKKVMNSVYRTLHAEFSPETVYNGSEINVVLLNVIKMVTLQMMQAESKIDVGITSNGDITNNEVRTENQVIAESVSSGIVRAESETAQSVLTKREPSPPTPARQISEEVVQRSSDDLTSEAPSETTVNEASTTLDVETASGVDIPEESVAIVSTAISADATATESDKNTSEETETAPVEVEAEKDLLAGQDSVKEDSLSEKPVVENVEQEEQIEVDERDKTGDEIAELEKVAESEPSPQQAEEQPLATTAEESVSVVNPLPSETVVLDTDSNPQVGADNKIEQTDKVDRVSITSSLENYEQATGEFFGGFSADNPPASDTKENDSCGDLTTEEIFFSPSGSEHGDVTGRATPTRDKSEDITPVTVGTPGRWSANAPIIDTEPPSIHSDSEASMSTADECTSTGHRDGDKGIAEKFEKVDTAEVEPEETVTAAATPGVENQTSSTTAAKTKQITSIFGDDDDDDDLFSSLSKVPPSRFTTPPRSNATPSRTETATTSTKKSTLKTLGDDDDRKPPPLFNDDSEDDVDWLS